MTRFRALQLQQDNINHLERRYVSVEGFLGAVHSFADVIPELHQTEAGSNAAQQGTTPEEALLGHICSTAPQLAAGPDIFSHLSNRLRLLPIGCDGVDELLRGGLREGHVVEIAGESATGKSQLCHSAAVITAHRGERVVVVDTSNAFNAARARQLSLAYQPEVSGRPVEEVLGSITVARPHTIYACLSCLDQLALQLGSSREASDRTTLLILDSVSAVLSPVLGSQQHNQGQVLAVTLGRMLRHLAERFSLAVLVTNHFVSAASSSSSSSSGGAGGGGSSSGQGLLQVAWQVPGSSGGLMKPALGEQWRSQPHARVQLTKDRGCTVATLTSSSLAAVGHQARFCITDQGLPRAP